MYISEIFKSKKPVLSFEVFPPKKTENLEKVKSTVTEISKIKVDYMSVTYGAGGSTSKLTPELAGYMQNELSVTALSHLTCVSLTRPQVKEMLETLKSRGIENILALRGDIPEGAEFPLPDGYRYASELTEDIKKFGGFCVGGACYPECHPDSSNIDEDIDNLKRKVDAGADFLVTQMFFDNNAFYDFRDRCVKKGINVPITAGLMPLTSANQVERMCVLSGGASMPSAFTKILSRNINNPEALRQAGIAYVINQIFELVSNDIDGIHIYTMNNPDTAAKIVAAVNGLFDIGE
ncbi:MAG: methylenetetrahydrofolate reductase [NAD(P)H] [Oscillospiraceae bacterium]|nr:methylenetetrahydrofolate reductase [NAD(P)H] [Oscillospiraceae bacterium]